MGIRCVLASLVRVPLRFAKRTVQTGVWRGCILEDQKAGVAGVGVGYGFDDATGLVA